MTGPRITVNGQERRCDQVSPHTRLLDWLRTEDLTGAKEGCAEGECGACAIMVARPDGDGKSRWTAVNACLPPALAFDGQEIVTAEGLKAKQNTPSESTLHPVQQEMATRGGSQCGYCTPGFICSMAAEFYRPERLSAAPLAGAPKAGAKQAEHECGPNGFDLHALSGNLCRCTGYRPIRDAAYALTSPDMSDPLLNRQSQSAPAAIPTRTEVANAEFIRPGTYKELLELIAENPTAVIVAGSTDTGVEVNLRHSRPKTVVAIDHLDSLRALKITADHVEIGAALTLTEIERRLHGQVPLLAQLFPQFASRLIRNAATLGGNLGTGSPIGDSAPALLALNASLILESVNRQREVALSDYFIGYRQTVREPAELIRAVRIPLPLLEHTAFYKVAKRRFDDISSVAVGISMQLEGDVVASIRLGLGGVAATPIRATQTEAALKGQLWSADVVKEAAAVLAEEGTPIDDLRASSAYRRAMLGNSLLKFFAETTTPALEVSR